jgi:hypothetical protein
MFVKDFNYWFENCFSPGSSKRVLTQVMYLFVNLLWSQDSAVGMATRLTGWTFRGWIPGEAEDLFTFRKCPDRLWGTRSPVFQGYGVSFLEVKWPEREGDHSFVSSTDVKNKCSCFCPPTFHGVHKDNFTCTFVYLWHLKSLISKY